MSWKQYQRVHQWLGSFLIPWLLHQLIKSGNNDPSKSTSWKVLETVLSHHKWTHSIWRRHLGLNFWHFPAANGKKEDNFARYTQIFKNFESEFPFHLIFLLEFSAQTFEFQKMRQFSDFTKNFPRKLPCHLPPSHESSGIFGWTEKAPGVSWNIWHIMY